MRTTLMRTVAQSLLTSSQRWWRDRAIRGSRDGTRLLIGRRLLVLSPHPDDETFGCGATIARATTAGAPVTLVVATDGRHSASSSRLTADRLATLRTAELRDAGRHLGLATEDIVQLGFTDGTLAGQPAALAAAIEDQLRRHRPNVVMFPCAEDNHPDHQAVYAAACRAVAAVAPGTLMLAYPVWSWHEAPWFLGSGVRHRARLMLWAARLATAGGTWRIPTGPHLAAKRAAVAAYVSQTTNLTGEDTWSFLSAEFQSAFLGRAEVFVPVDESARKASLV